MNFSDFVVFYYGYNLLLLCKQHDLIKKAKEENSIINMLLLNRIKRNML